MATISYDDCWKCDCCLASRLSDCAHYSWYCVYTASEKINMKRLLLLFTILCFFRIVPTAHAADATEPPPMNITLSPVTVQLSADPGAVVSSDVKLRNNTTFPEHLHVVVGKFRPDRSGDHRQLLDPDPNDETLQWLHTNEGEFIIQPSEWKTLHVSFSPPATASGAEYYTLMFSRSSVTSKPGAEVVSGSPAILVLTTINSPFNKRELTLSQFTTNGNFQEFLPKSFQIEVKNTGNVHLIPQGNIFIDGQGKKDLAVLSINPNALTSLPDATRTYTVTWSNGFPIQIGAEGGVEGIKFLGLTWDLSKGD